MPKPKPASDALVQTLPIYGDVFRAQGAFETEVVRFLLAQLAKACTKLAAYGFAFSKGEPDGKPWQNSWAHWIYVRQPFKHIGRLKAKGDAALLLYVGWRRLPESEAQVLPFAYLEVNYHDAGDRDAWKSRMVEVRKTLPVGVESEVYKSYSDFMRIPEDDSTYRNSLAELASDFELLLRALGDGFVKTERRPERFAGS